MSTPDTETISTLAFHLLLALADGEKHGYAIIKEIERRTDHRIRPRSGTLYNTIQRLMDSGLVKEVSGRFRDTSRGPRRRYYRLTSAGRRVAAEETERMARLVSVARAALS